MKFKSLLLPVSGIVLCLAACHKDTAPGNLRVDGKWQQTKLRIYADSAGVIKYDTTYTKPFTASDYIQFNANGTCAIGSDHYYYPNIDNYPKTPQLIPLSISEWKYNLVGNSTYVLNQQNTSINPGGFRFITTDTVRILSAHSLWLHSASYSQIPAYVQIFDSYYEK